MTRLWFRGLLVRRPVRLLGAATGVALTVALFFAIIIFITASSTGMTQRAVTTVPVDWQAQLTPGTSPEVVRKALLHATPVEAEARVDYAQISGLEATTAGTSQVTGPGKVLGLPPGYLTTFPGQVRVLLGSLEGALVAQQTAANLHVSVGDLVRIRRVGLPPATVVVAGVVELPNANSMLQAVGLPPGSVPRAPPDNVVLLPQARWHALFGPQAKLRLGSVRTQLHVRLNRATLPSDPVAAYLDVTGRARNFEAQVAGQATVANNLAARLDGTRSDALFSRVLFLFLGTPGVLLAALLTLAVTRSGRESRIQEQALLRTRGASLKRLLQLASLEAFGVGTVGIAFGLLLALSVSRSLLGSGLRLTTGAAVWCLLATILGLSLAAAAVVLPAWRDLRGATVVAARASARRTQAPLWQRLYPDVFLLALAAVVFWQTARSGYQVVLAPEGVAQSSVNYYAFVAPASLWFGAGLLAFRFWWWLLGPGQSLMTGLFRPGAGKLADIVVASLGRQRRRLAASVVLVALAFSFAASTAIFNKTYAGQARVDALLTNGADVNVTGTTAAPAGAKLAALEALPGVEAAQAMQHRFAFVGADLQDLYGVNPARIGEATVLADSYFKGGDARATLQALSARPDGVLVSEETVRDFQLNLGDRINLRLQRASDRHYQQVPFTFVGVAREFPTAPKDSFLVANATYLARRTGTAAAEVVLLRTRDPLRVAKVVRPLVSALPGVEVTSLGQAQSLISSSLTAVNARGLARLELTFAFGLLAAASGLFLGLGLAERRHTLAILGALGATRSQLGVFIWSEGLFVLFSGALIGLGIGVGVAWMLVKVLTGVFDPPPDALAVPYSVLFGLVATAWFVTGLALLSAQTSAHRNVVTALRDVY